MIEAAARRTEAVFGCVKKSFHYAGIILDMVCS